MVNIGLDFIKKNMYIWYVIRNYTTKLVARLALLQKTIRASQTSHTYPCNTNYIRVLYICTWFNELYILACSLDCKTTRCQRSWQRALVFAKLLKVILSGKTSWLAGWLAGWLTGFVNFSRLRPEHRHRVRRVQQENKQIKFGPSPEASGAGT